jgi:hypothetical protein
LKNSPAMLTNSVDALPSALLAGAKSLVPSPIVCEQVHRRSLYGLVAPR